ncbi:hypothetical protein VFPPC_05386 [Pochonia chlamydosporia 170]|uniref:CENP-V/GFA domain-containing protein n=1 Tax=Pochonia chlamydosporia 170 TaxID=1380566 RepID=A0A179FEV1_METCM|nr:hypothetical protein VFPPC_05386 [Pochonia chlamydosporia 170]OAQ64042.1 hypothetical protein VFPPC_05386 [Pochonia chlamydosporia 170]
MGSFHLRPADVRDDFLLLSPLDPFEDLGDYLTFDKEIHMFFCKICGVRCFTFTGLGEVVDINASVLELPDAAKTGALLTKAWRAVRGSGSPEFGTTINVNGHTIDAGQPEFDMRELTEKKCVQYLDTFSDWGKGSPPRWDRPQDHGCY